MVVTVSCLARSTARKYGLSEADVKRARKAWQHRNDEPGYAVFFADLDDGRTLRMRCRHDDLGAIVSLSLT
jgi:hypothetical protein